eukprot:1196284-Pyramimonas_sp.AAC.1
MHRCDLIGGCVRRRGPPVQVPYFDGRPFDTRPEWWVLRDYSEDGEEIENSAYRCVHSRSVQRVERALLRSSQHSCCAVLCCALLYCALLCCAVLCCAVLYCAVLCCAVLCCAVPCRAVLCCAVLCCAVLCRAVPC